MAKPQVILSMASYPARIDTVASALGPLFHQTVTPDLLLLWLPTAEFAEAGKELPEELAELERLVPYFEIRWTEESLKPHNKYFWTMTEYPDDIIITLDDDLIYETSLVQKLLDYHYKYPQAIITNRSHLVTLNEDRTEVAPYAEWVMEQKSYLHYPRADILSTNGAGTLFPPHILPKGTFDAEGIKATSLLADDMWLMTWMYLGDVPILPASNDGLRYLDNTQDTGLYHLNLGRGENDAHLARLYEMFPEFKDKLLSRVSERVEQELVHAETMRQAALEQERKISLLRKVARKLKS